ncbi:MAG: VWA domain-containing protein [Acidobacteriota bacterium]|nr:VWA domain-containing protein [Acidobacteriota bacterium]
MIPFPPRCLRSLPRARGWLALIATSLSLVPAGAQVLGEEERIVVLRPRPTDLMLGPSVVSLLPMGVDDAAVEQIEIRLDGEIMGVLRQPPWRLTIDAGERLGPRTLEVIARLKGDRQLTTTVDLRPAGVGTVDVRLVDLAVTVVDAKGKTVTGLEEDDFRIFDGGREVTIDRWGDKPTALAVALVLDASLSMRPKLREVQKAAQAFVAALAPRDRVSVVAFNESSRIITPLDADRRASIEAIEGLEARGGTALYDALFDAGKALQAAGSRARKVAVILSDGRDEAASGLEPGSFHTLREAVRKAHDSDLVVFTIGLGADLDEQDFSGRMTHAEALTRMATSTGGRFFKLRRLGRLGRVYRDILEELRHQYSIAYKPPPPRPGETWRSIEVRVGRPGLTVRTREGYFVH